MIAFSVVNFEDRPDLRHATDSILRSAWPHFMLADPIAARYWDALYGTFPRYQYALVAEGTEQIIAVGNSVPIAFDGDMRSLSPEGWDWALQKAFDDHAAGRPPTMQCALSVSVAPSMQGQGYSIQAVQAMRAIGISNNLSALVAPVRPMYKSRYPLIPMEQYIGWRNDDGYAFDGWLRVHERLGASIVGVCPRSMRITGTIEQWQQWTAMRLPETGSYVIPGALLPIQIDCEADQGEYIEPNVWMYHNLR